MLRDVHGEVATVKEMVWRQDSKIEAIGKLVEEKEARDVKRHKETTATIAGFLRQGADFFEKTNILQEPQDQGQLVPTQQSVVVGDGEANPLGACTERARQGEDSHGEDEVDELVRVSGSQVSFRRKNGKALNLLDMYKEYYGLGGYYGVPILGGYYGLDKKHKNKWRLGYSAADNVFYSRLKALMGAMAQFAGVEEGHFSDSVVAVAQDWQQLLRAGGLAGAVQKLKADGLIGKKGARA